MESFEYAIKKDVRNNPIVREVDAARQRDQWKWAGVTAFVLLLLLFTAWQHSELLYQGYQVEKLQRERAMEEDKGQRLRLQILQLRSTKRIEDLATRQLHLVHPGRDEAIILTRFAPAEAPAQSVVARR